MHFARKLRRGRASCWPACHKNHEHQRLTNAPTQFADSFTHAYAGHHGHPGAHHPAMAAAVAAAGLHPDTDTDPRELEAFAERFKQRRIKLGSAVRKCCAR